MARWPLTTEQRFEQRVHRTDTCWVWTGRKTEDGYGLFHQDGKQRRAHRVAYERAHGPIPEGALIDHICRTRDCVNPEHLRVTDRKGNAENVVGEYRDVYPVRRKFRVLVTHNNVKQHGGYYDTREEAAKAARELRNRLFTHNDSDRLNPPAVTP